MQVDEAQPHLFFTGAGEPPADGVPGEADDGTAQRKRELEATGDRRPTQKLELCSFGFGVRVE